MEADGSFKMLVLVYLNLQCHILRTPQASCSPQEENQILSVQKYGYDIRQRPKPIYREKKENKMRSYIRC
jgi:hypothetical protein